MTKIQKINCAVILAAGMGKRLKKIFTGKPKGAIRIGNQTIIERSISQLKSIGIERIIVVTGYKSEFYEKIADKYKNVETIKNISYEKSGSMYSLYCAKSMIRSDFILLESDLIYDYGGLEALIKFPKENAILLSGWTNSGDEVYAETANNRIIKLSKNKKILKCVEGELVGISKISKTVFKKMIKYSEKYFNNSLKLDYEDCFNGIAREEILYFCKINNLLWAEIDDESHYERAKNVIYPQIMIREGKN